MGHLDTPLHDHALRPPTDGEDAAVREQLQRLISSPPFSHSKRYPAFLQYIVEKTLSGHADELKERTIGTDVFHRVPHYDTSADPIVRVTAAEIRKRLAQYYFEPGHETELRIELIPGTYVPVFHPYGENPVAVGSGSAENDPPLQLMDATATVTLGTEIRSVAPPVSIPYRIPSRKWLWLLPVFALFFIAWSSLHGIRTARYTAFEQFWGQIVNADGPVQICYGAYEELIPTGPGLPLAMDAWGSTGSIVRVLGQRSKTYSTTIRMIGPGPTDFAAFRHGPVIYFGPLSPVAPLTDSWRYRFMDTDPIWIADTKTAGKKLWRVESYLPPTELSESYAIGARLIDPVLKRPVIIVVAFSRVGVSAGVDLLTTPEYLEPVLKSAPQGWQEMNMQFVVETRVLEGKRGKPNVVATHYWKDGMVPVGTAHSAVRPSLPGLPRDGN